MGTISRSYVLIALLWLVAGMAEGFWMGATNSLQYRDFHVAMLLPGFVTLAVYGAVYRLWPQLEAARLATLQFWLAVSGSLLIVLGTLQQVLTGSVVIDRLGIGQRHRRSGALALPLCRVGSLERGEVGGERRDLPLVERPRHRHHHRVGAPPLAKRAQEIG